MLITDDNNCIYYEAEHIFFLKTAIKKIFVLVIYSNCVSSVKVGLA